MAWGSFVAGSLLSGIFFMVIGFIIGVLAFKSTRNSFSDEVLKESIKDLKPHEKIEVTTSVTKYVFDGDDRDDDDDDDDNEEDPDPSYIQSKLDNPTTFYDRYSNN